MSYSSESSSGHPKEAPPPHNFYDHTAHMQWKAEREKYVTSVPMIPSDLSGGSRPSATSASIIQQAFSNPLVPLGMFATVGCLIGIMTSMLRRNSSKAQLFMRGRCIAQGLTVASLVGGAMLFDIKPKHAGVHSAVPPILPTMDEAAVRNAP